MQRTVLHPEHEALGAKMAPFAGFDMPIQYDGILAEHDATRRHVTIFDTCHMTELIIRGDAAQAGLGRLVSCDVKDLPVGRCRYGLLCNEQGGVIDDQILYRLGAAEFMIVLNAGTRAKDVAWIRSQLPAGAVQDVSDQTAKVDIQGPESVRLVQALLDEPLPPLRYYTFCRAAYRDEGVLVSRTGYTGEIGFEIYCPIGAARALWQDCLSRGARPAGLGARDTLRLEMGFPLYGHELSEDRNAAGAGLTRAISSCEAFIGSEAVREAAAAPELQLVGLALAARRAARQGDVVLDHDGGEAGVVTSGSFAPSVGHAVALAYVVPDAARIGSSVQVDNGRRMLAATVSALPFYRHGTARRLFGEFVV